VQTISFCTLTYSLGGTYDPAVVSINAATGVVTVNTALVANNGDSYSLTIIATDIESTSASPSASFAFVLNLNAPCNLSTLTAPAFGPTYATTYTRDVW